MELWRQGRFEECGRNGFQLSGSAVERPAGFQTAHQSEPPIGTSVELRVFAIGIGSAHKRNDDIEGAADFDAEEAGRGDADDIERVTLERHRLSEELPATAAVFAAPERVADHGRAGASATIVRRVQQAACFGLHAEHVEEVAADPEDVRRADFAAVRQVDLIRAPGEDSGKALLLGSDLFPLRIGGLRITAAEAAGAVFEVADFDDGELLGMLDGDGAQADGVEELEDGGVGSNAEGERKNRDQGEAGIEKQEAEAVAGVLEKVLKHRLL